MVIGFVEPERQFDCRVGTAGNNYFTDSFLFDIYQLQKFIKRLTRKESIQNITGFNDRVTIGYHALAAADDGRK